MTNVTPEGVCLLKYYDTDYSTHLIDLYLRTIIPETRSLIAPLVSELCRRRREPDIVLQNLVVESKPFRSCPSQSARPTDRVKAVLRFAKSAVFPPRIALLNEQYRSES